MRRLSLVLSCATLGCGPGHDGPGLGVDTGPWPPAAIEVAEGVCTLSEPVVVPVPLQHVRPAGDGWVGVGTRGGNTVLVRVEGDGALRNIAVVDAGDTATRGAVGVVDGLVHFARLVPEEGEPRLILGVFDDTLRPMHSKEIDPLTERGLSGGEMQLVAEAGSAWVLWNGWDPDEPGLLTRFGAEGQALARTSLGPGRSAVVSPRGPLVQSYLVDGRARLRGRSFRENAGRIDLGDWIELGRLAPTPDLVAATDIGGVVVGAVPDVQVRTVDVRGAAFGGLLGLGKSTGRVSTASVGEGALVAWNAVTQSREAPRMVVVGMAGDAHPVPLPPLSHDGVGLPFPPRLHGGGGALIAWWTGEFETHLSRCTL